MPTTAGMLDRLVTVEKKSVTKDSTFGTELIAWVPLMPDSNNPSVAIRFWASVQPVGPGKAEAKTQGIIIAKNQVRIQMRWRNDVDSSMRITVHGDTDVIYQIIGGPAEIEGRKQLIEVLCERFSS